MSQSSLMFYNVQKMNCGRYIMKDVSFKGNVIKVPKTTCWVNDFYIMLSKTSGVD